MGKVYPMRITTERQVIALQKQVAHLEQALEYQTTTYQELIKEAGDALMDADERCRDLDEINAMLEDEIEYRRDLEEMNEMLNDQWFDLIMENQSLRTALEQSQQECEQITDKLNFATMMYGAAILSDEYENREED